MNMKLKELLGEPIAAADGEIGEVQAILFDDTDWRVRHLVLKAGGGLTGRKVLLPPDALRRSGSPHASLAVALTRRDLMRGPGIDDDPPVSEQYEQASAAYHGRGLDADQDGAGGLAEAEREASRSHLQTSAEVIGYSVHGLDGPLGHVEDLVLDDESWRVMSLLVGGRAGTSVRVAPDSVREIDWKTREVRLNLRREQAGFR